MQAIGRWGNFFNQELYGPPTDLPWGIAIDCAHRVGGYPCDTFPLADDPLPAAVPVRVGVGAPRCRVPHLAVVPAAAPAPAGRPPADLPHLVRHGPVPARVPADRQLASRRDPDGPDRLARVHRRGGGRARLPPPDRAPSDMVGRHPAASGSFEDAAEPAEDASGDPPTGPGRAGRAGRRQPEPLA